MKKKRQREIVMIKYLENTLKRINEILDSGLFRGTIIFFSVLVIFVMNFFLLYRILIE